MALEQLDSAVRESNLDKLIAAYLAAADFGHAPEPQQLIAEHPGLAAELTSFFESQQSVESWTLPLRPIAQAALTSVLSRAAEKTGLDQAVREILQPIDPSFGNYELLERIGQGGMGVVYKARQRNPNRLVAIKMIRLSTDATAAELARFRNEAEVAARLAHPNIMPIYAVGEHAGHLFFSMKLIEGGSLAEQLDQFRKDPRTAARLLATIARAVHHAHQHGILHRDLKPSNVLLDVQQPIVTDFGLSKHLDAETTLTDSGAIVGTPAYMAPEQTGNERFAITTASDVYGLGATLYAMLTGRPPFRASSALDTLTLVREQAPQPPRALNPRIDRDLETICLKSLAKDPNRRYSSAETMAEDLERWLAGEPIHARPVGRAERLWLWCRRNPVVASLAGTAALLVFVVLVGLAAGIALLGREHAEALRHQRSAEKQEAAAVEKARELHSHLYTAHIKLAHEAWSTGNVRRAVELLASYDSLTNPQDDLRGFEWHYLWRLCHGDAHVLRGHQGEVYAAAFSPDGKTLATGGQDGRLVLWDVATRSTTAAWQAHDDCVNTASFSGDGRLLATASCDRTVKVWDTVNWSENPIQTINTGVKSGASFSPDGNMIASWGEEGGVKLWDATTGKELGVLGSDHGPIHSVAFSPDGKRLATARRETGGILWDIEQRQRIGKLRDPDGNPYHSVAFSHDGRRIAAGVWEGTVRLYEDTGDTAIKSWQALSGRVDSVAFSADDQLLAVAGSDATARLWDLRTGKLRNVFAGHGGHVWRAVFSPNSDLLATVSSDRTARLWNPQSADAWRPLRVLTPIVSAIAFSSDGRLIATGTEREGTTTKVWDPEQGQLLCELPRVSPAMLPVALSHDLKTAAAGQADRSIRLYDVATGSERLLIRGLNADVAKLVFSADDSTLAGLTGDRVALWDARSGRLKTTLLNQAALDTTLAFSPDATTLLTATQEIKLWDATTGEFKYTLGSHGNHVDCAAFSADGTVLATGARNGTVKLWDLTSGSERATLLGHLGGVTSLAFTPDGKTLASGGADKTVRLWRVRDAQELLTLEAHTQAVHTVAFSSDGKTLVSAADSHEGPGEILLWSAHSSLPTGSVADR